MPSRLSSTQTVRSYRTQARGRKARQVRKVREALEAARRKEEAEQREAQAVVQRKADEIKARADYIAANPHLCGTPRALALLQEGARHSSVAARRRELHTDTYFTEAERNQCCPSDYVQTVRKLYSEGTQGCKFYQGGHDDVMSCSLCGVTRNYNDIASSAYLYHGCDHSLSFAYTSLSFQRGGAMISDTLGVNLCVERKETYSDRRYHNVCLECVKVFPYKVLDVMKAQGIEVGEDKHWLNVPNLDRTCTPVTAV